MRPFSGRTSRLRCRAQRPLSTVVFTLALLWSLEGHAGKGLDPQGTYTVRLTGYGQSLLRLDGDRVTPSVDGKEIGEFKEFPVPPHRVQDGRLVLTWDSPTNESN